MSSTGVMNSIPALSYRMLGCKPYMYDSMKDWPSTAYTFYMTRNIDKPSYFTLYYCSSPQTPIAYMCKYSPTRCYINTFQILDVLHGCL